MRSLRIRSLGSLAIGLALLYFVTRRFDLDHSLDAIAGANPRFLLLAFALMALAYALRGARWLIWDRSITYGCSLKAIFVGFMGNNVLPERLGEVLRADWLARRLPNPSRCGRTSTLATIAGERVMDGVVLSLFAVIGVAFVAMDRPLRLSLVAMIASFGVLGAALAVVVLRDGAIRELIGRINQAFPGHLTRFAKTKANHAVDGLVRFKGPLRLLAIFLATAVIWFVEVGFYWAVAQSIHPTPLVVCALFVAVTSFASLFPLTVGGIGAIEGISTAMLTYTGIPAFEAFAMVLIQHVFQLAFTTFLGGTVYLSDPVRSRASTVGAEPFTPNRDSVARTQRSLDRLRADVAIEAPRPQPVHLSIVIPAYNEHNRLPRTALETIRWCNLNRLKYEIVIVDDGSTDDTLEIAKLLEDHDSRVRCLACPHSGKGMAVRLGMLNARGEYVLFMDADGATPLTEIPKLLAELEQGYSIAIGSRILQQPGEVVIDSPLHRRMMGRVFAFFVNVVAVSGLADTQCGFKMFRRQVVTPVFSRQKLNGFAFDVEVLFIARRLGLSISEVPVNWQNQEGSKVNLVLDSARMLRDVMRVRWLHRHEEPLRSHEPAHSTDNITYQAAVR